MLPPDYKVCGEVMDIINNVAMVLPWNTGHERIFKTSQLKPFRLNEKTGRSN